MNEGEPRWTEVARLDALPAESLTPVRRGDARVLLVRGDGDEVFAVENRCPHEGYALSQGYLKGAALTCAWHNWKFDVRDGACLLGEEGVRTWPVRVVDGRVEVDLREPDPAEFRPRWWKSLREGLREHELGRVVREGVRLLGSGVDPWELLLEAARDDARRGEWGTTHVLPLAADCGRMLDRHPGAEAMVAVAPALRMGGENHLRLPERVLAEPLAGATRETLRAAVEAEEVARVEGLVRGALAAGQGRELLEDWLFALVADHFTDFGHPLIYLVKAQELLRHGGDEDVAVLVPALVRGITLATREDTLPYLAPYFRDLPARAAAFPGWWEHARNGVERRADGLRNAVLDGEVADAVGALWQELESGTRLTCVAEALVAAAAERVHRFDPALEFDPGVAEGWLWVTHRLTFAAAVRHAVERWPRPEVLRLLLQAVAFVHSGRAMDGAERGTPTPRGAATVDDVVEAITRSDMTGAVSAAAAVLRDGGVDALRVALEELTLGDRWVRPIYQAHAVKMVVAAFEEAAAMSDHPDQAAVRLAAVRFLAAPVCEGRLQATVRASIDWVAHQRMPRKLTQ